MSTDLRALRPAAGAARLRVWLIERLSGISGLTPSEIDPAAPFDVFGVNSTDAVSISGEIADEFELDVDYAALYEHPTVDRLVAALYPSAATAASGVASVAPAAVPDAAAHSAPRDAEDAVCIVGMACRFPGGADTPEDFWRLLAEGRTGYADLPADRWNEVPEVEPDRPGGVYTTRGGFVARATEFDADFFGISPREAELMEPQQRMLLETSWEALERAGLAADRLRGARVGVFVGMMSDARYASLHVGGDGGARLEDPYLGLGIAASVVAGRLSYLLDLHGPALVLDTACSSALVALDLAVQAIRRGECDTAIVGGVNAITHPDTFRQACAMRMLARDGLCKAFDARADGYVIGEGCGVIVVEQLSAARAAGRAPLAVVRASAVNQDGASNGLTAPNGAAQAAVIRTALRRAGLEPGDVDYVEAHGSGTMLGDTIELNALHQVFGAERAAGASALLLVGAVKTNVGHLIGASGMAGLIKTVLALRHGRVPANLHLETVNPGVAEALSTVALPDRLTDWPRAGTVRRAGVSSFGWSGTNAHVLLESVPEAESETESGAEPGPRSADGPGPQTLLLSARGGAALEAQARRLAEHLAAHPRQPLAEVARTTRFGRSALPLRTAVVAGDADAARRALEEFLDGRGEACDARTEPAVTFLLPGTGEHRPGMGAQLYRTEPAYRAAIDACAEAAREALGLDLRDLLAVAAPDVAADGAALPGFGPAARPAGPSPLDRIEVAHAAVFAVDYASATLWRHRGVEPAALLGYSLGELAAAAVAGVFDLDDAVHLVVERARLVAETPEGAMTTVALASAQTEPLLPPGADIAAHNGPRATVVSGPLAAIDAFEARLAEAGVAFRRLATDRAMHSAVLAGIEDALAALFEKAERHAPSLPLWSNLTGAPVTAEQALDARFWARQACRPVRFAEAVEQLGAAHGGLLVEAGPGMTGSLAVQILGAAGVPRPTAVGTLSRMPGDSDALTLARGTARLWMHGVAVDWSACAPGPGRLADLPTYPFERRRYWPEQGGLGARRADVGSWFAVPRWSQLPPLPAPAAPAGRWVLLADRAGLAEALADALAERGCEAVVVETADEPRPSGPGRRVVRPRSREDLRALLAELACDGAEPPHLVQFGGVDPVDPARPTRDFFALLALAQALGDLPGPKPRLSVVTTGVFDVTGRDRVEADKATVLGPLRVLPYEQPDLALRHLDVDLDPARVSAGEVAALLAELAADAPPAALAARAGRRWGLDYAALPPVPAADPPFTDGGVYLITGGFGGIGAAMATAIATTARAVLVLAGRTALPDRAHWDGPETAALPNPVRERIALVRRLEDLGARVHPVVLDAGDEAAVTQLLADLHRRFGRIDGVLHAAGVPGVGLMHFKTEQTAAEVLAPKLGAARALLADTPHRPGFTVLFSSTAALIGGPGQADYAAANAYLDAAAAAAHRPGGPRVLAVDWAEWQWNAWADELAGFDRSTAEFLRRNRREVGISFEEGWQALCRALAVGQPHLVVSPQDINVLLASALRLGRRGASPAALPPSRRHPRPELGVALAPPLDERERALAELWCAALGLTEVGVHDNYFELGGNSLVAVDLIARMRTALGSPDLPPHILYEAPTIASVLTLVPSLDSAAPGDEPERAARRRQAVAARAARGGRR